MLSLLQMQGISASVLQATMSVSEFQTNSNLTWSENAGTLACATRSAYLLMNGTLTMTPVGTVTHTLSEAQGTLSLSGLQIAMVKALANDVTVCGETEPCAYVTEYFQGDGTTLQFDLTEKPWMPAPSKSKPVSDNFDGPSINPQLWNVEDPGMALRLTSAGLTCGGGGSQLGTTVLWPRRISSWAAALSSKLAASSSARTPPAFSTDFSTAGKPRWPNASPASRSARPAAPLPSLHW